MPGTATCRWAEAVPRQPRPRPPTLAEERNQDEEDDDDQRHPGPAHDVERTLLARSRSRPRLGRVGVERRRRLARDLVLALDDRNQFLGVDDVLALVVAHTRQPNP